MDILSSALSIALVMGVSLFAVAGAGVILGLAYLFLKDRYNSE